jgi:hypothetical protein
MELYIRIADGQPVDHPILRENLLQAFPDIDLLNSKEFVPFQQVPEPILGPYDKSVSNYYAIVDGMYKNVWVVEPMNEDERIEKQNQVKLEWNQQGFSSWKFNEETCSFDPPIPYPIDDNIYQWDEEQTKWIIIQI